MFKRLLFIIIILAIGIVLFFYVFSSETKKETDKRQKKEVKENVVIDIKSNTNLFLYPKKTNNQIVYYSRFALSYNENAEQADWVAYRLYHTSTNDNVKRKNNFKADLEIVTGSASLADYKKSGYDRGHLAPAKAMSYNKQSMSESFLMSNMSPQLPSFNRGIWKKLEGQVRRWIAISDSLYVVTGPVLEKPLGSIGTNKVLVPKAYYKVVLRFRNKSLKGLGFLLNHEKSSKEIAEFSVSIDSIESVTGLNFFYLLDSIQQQKIESNTSYSQFIK